MRKQSGQPASPWWRKLSRNLTVKIHFFLDQCIPPVMRDAKWFMYLPFKLFFRNHAELLLDFKDRALDLSEAEFANAYKAVQAFVPVRETDLNADCLKRILECLRGETVLDVGAGRGFLAGRMSATHQVMAIDIVVDSRMTVRYPEVRFVVGNIERLPFRDSAFDTVVCAHTLEHVQQIFMAISELRRVAKRRVIIVVPKQRPYRYTFDLHIHFFPYPTSLLAMLNSNHRSASCMEIGGDLFYSEDLLSAEIADEERERLYEPTRSRISTRQ